MNTNWDPRTEKSESFIEKVRDVDRSQISTAPGEIGKIMPAIRRKGPSSLLNHLFKAPHGKDNNEHGVPAYVVSAIADILQQQVLSDNTDWDKKREDFYKTHPIMKHAVRTTVLNFWNNIAQCCGRVLVDWKTISNIFFPGNPIQQLTEIKVTDSDPHKGGKQVLILTFDLGKKLVYKPSDLAADCLLIGQSTALKKSTTPALSNFFKIQGGDGKETQSLMEIINAEIDLLYLSA